ncbi:uncharacterized protein PHACADRAFT_116588 [Phanerochaete carnosa HHB-10118-sp]|uniref:Domain of unknown function at the cortex 1 domain-containing protein n=1 Tax=Phanerochaete carnosa (strain HHB-10118-sp) TaxID=650164 RepID=K5X589_PHACS|nr:uncharacterized protein PHACADRAFT_116588 [Phanerochaete carnosa HHB-10118-sp]EKM58022.1 hypothetical protein PHACADRAFT_116588 [Phanerochaete carnosa HHB-10118-sp]
MPRLRILVGSSPGDLKPVRANTGEAVHISNDAFEGDIALYIKNFADQNGHVQDSTYFKQRPNVTWSIQVQGRFLRELSANDILFGNIFDRPLAIPWGFSAILAFMQYMDPTLEQDLQSKTKPWALAPLISTMPYFAHMRADELHKVPPFPPLSPVQDDTKELRLKSGGQPEHLPADNNPESRRAYFRDPENRKAVVFGPNDIITTDFCYDYLSFSPSGVTLQLPAGMTFDMMRYWDGQPVHFVCCERAPAEQESGQPLGKIFWCVGIEVLEGEEEESEKQQNDTGQQVNNDDVD